MDDATPRLRQHNVSNRDLATKISDQILLGGTARGVDRGQRWALQYPRKIEVKEFLPHLNLSFSGAARARRVKNAMAKVFSLNPSALDFRYPPRRIEVRKNQFPSPSWLAACSEQVQAVIPRAAI